MDQQYSCGLMWFRRDLRCEDNAALYHALKCCERVHCAFVFDTDILDELPRADRRVEFIRESVVQLDSALRAMAGDLSAGLITHHARAQDDIAKLAQAVGAQAVFINHDDEPRALARDAQVLGHLADAGVMLHSFKDHTIFERDELLTQAGNPYSVYTPYKNAWLKKVDDFYLRPYPVAQYAGALVARPEQEREAVPSLKGLGFEATNLSEIGIPPGITGANALFEEFFDRMDDYQRNRDFPALHGCSHLGVHLRFGTISIRTLASVAHRLATGGSPGAQTWLSELIWRDFFFQVMHHFPHVVGHAFRPEYDKIKWEHGKHGDALFTAWCEGRTGYPLVDAAMAQINQTGFMHNRLRMVAASFLVKSLGIDWRRGEAYFAEKLNDFELSSNNGNWQWAASSGCDAQPWFRIFNPVTQSQRFDAEGNFIRRYLPQLGQLPGSLIHAPWTATPIELEAAGIHLGKDYPEPIVNHQEAREATLARYAVVKSREAPEPAR
jgi:deoxyribodipyrimidine photo-lyase